MDDTKETASTADTLPIWKHYSTWVATIAALLQAAPINWDTLDLTKLSSTDVIKSVVFIVLFLAAKNAKQTPPNTTTPEQPQ